MGSKAEVFIALGMSQDTIERPRHAGEVQRVDEQLRVADLPATVGADEAPKLCLAAASSPRRLLLEGAERSKLALGLDDLFHTGGTQAADQLVLQVGDAHVEPEGFQLGAAQVGAEAGPLETAPEVALLTGVTQARQPEDPLNQHDRLWVDAWGQRVCRRGNQPSISVASQRLDGCQLESLRVVHLPSLVLQP